MSLSSAHCQQHERLDPWCAHCNARAAAKAVKEHRRSEKKMSPTEESIFNDFVRGYVDAALWSSNENYSRGDITRACMAKMRADCRKFFRANRADLRLYAASIRYDRNKGTPYDYAGHDFWLTRNGHGSGFWDRDGVGDSDAGLGDRLSEAARDFGECSLYVSRGKIHCST